jgi:ribonuclease D
VVPWLVTIRVHRGSEPLREKLRFLLSQLHSWLVLNILVAVVDTEEELSAFLERLQDAAWVAVDTEADSLHAYPEKLCLIQISTAAEDRLIDPLASLELLPLLKALSAHELIMHGADYDLRLLRKHHAFVPGSIFDTMLAARLLGIRQFSLGDLVEKHLGVKLEKGPQKANWALRPLSLKMEHYARNDTHHLKPLADRLRMELDQKARLDWHKESCARLISDCTHERPSNPDSGWRLKGSHLLSGRALATLRELWHWREKEAIRANRPPFFVLSHDALVAISSSAAGGHSYLHLLPRHFSERRSQGLVAAVEKGLAILAEHQPRPLRVQSRRPTEGERRNFAMLEKRRNLRAADLGIDPTLIASRATLSDLAHDWDKHSGDLMVWQRQLLVP